MRAVRPVLFCNPFPWGRRSLTTSTLPFSGHTSESPAESTLHLLLMHCEDPDRPRSVEHRCPLRAGHSDDPQPLITSHPDVCIPPCTGARSRALSVPPFAARTSATLPLCGPALGKIPRKSTGPARGHTQRCPACCSPLPELAFPASPSRLMLSDATARSDLCNARRAAGAAGAAACAGSPGPSIR